MLRWNEITLAHFGACSHIYHPRTVVIRQLMCIPHYFRGSLIIKNIDKAENLDTKTTEN